MLAGITSLLKKKPAKPEDGPDLLPPASAPTTDLALSQRLLIANTFDSYAASTFDCSATASFDCSASSY